MASWIETGKTHYAADRYDEALECYEQARASGANPAEVEYFIAIVHLARGDRGRGMEHLRRSLAHDSHYVPAMSQLGQQAEMAGHLIEAEHWFRLCLKRQPTHRYAEAALARLASHRPDAYSTPEQPSIPNPRIRPQLSDGSDTTAARTRSPALSGDERAQSTLRPVSQDEPYQNETRNTDMPGALAAQLDAAASFAASKTGPGELRHEWRRTWRSYMTYLPLPALPVAAALTVEKVWPDAKAFDVLWSAIFWASWPSVLLITVAWVFCDRAVTRYRFYEHRIDVVHNPILRHTRRLWFFEADKDIYVTRNLIQTLLGTATINIESTTLPMRYPLFAMKEGGPQKTEIGRLRLIGVGSDAEMEEYTEEITARVVFERRGMKKGFI